MAVVFFTGRWAWLLGRVRGAASACFVRGAAGAAVPPRLSFACLSTLPNGLLGNRFAGALRGRAAYASVLRLCAGAEDSSPRRFIGASVLHDARFTALCQRFFAFYANTWGLVHGFV